jgi:hypothetical protein
MAFAMNVIGPGIEQSEGDHECDQLPISHFQKGRRLFVFLITTADPAKCPRIDR